MVTGPSTRPFLPDGQIKKTCPAPLRKIFRLTRRANQGYQLAPSFPGKRGDRASSRTWGRMRWTRQRRRANGGAGQAFTARERSTGAQTNDADAYGKTVWSRHPLLVPSCRWRVRSDRIGGSAIKPAATVTRRIRRRGERGISRKTIAQGRRNAPTVPVCSCACSYAHIARETAGAACTRHSLLPLIGEAGTFREKLARLMRREREAVFGAKHSTSSRP